MKYAYVYDVTPQVVYVGCTPGYYGTYVWGPTIVYGTGYWYRPRVSPHLRRLAEDVGPPRDLEPVDRLVVRVRRHPRLLQLRRGLARAPGPGLGGEVPRPRRLLRTRRLEAALLGTVLKARSGQRERHHQQ